MNNLVNSACFKVAVVLVCCLVLTGCATVSTAKVPDFRFDAENGVYKALAVSYGSDTKQKFDIYLPENYQSLDSLDIVVYIHGGSYYTGSRSERSDMLVEMTRRGIAVVSLDYRLVSPTNTIFLKEMFEDVCTAIDKIAFVFNASNIKLDKAALMGISAGAHFAMLYSYKMIETSPLDLVFCIDYVGPADLTDEAFLGKVEEKRFAKLGKMFKKRLKVENMSDAIPYFREYSPIEYLKPESIPTICAYAKKDVIVPFSVCETFAAKLESLGCTYELTVFPNSNHGLEAPEDAPLHEIVTGQIEDYMKKYF